MKKLLFILTFGCMQIDANIIKTGALYRYLQHFIKRSSGGRSGIAEQLPKWPGDYAEGLSIPATPSRNQKLVFHEVERIAAYTQDDSEVSVTDVQFAHIKGNHALINLTNTQWAKLLLNHSTINISNTASPYARRFLEVHGKGNCITIQDEEYPNEMGVWAPGSSLDCQPANNAPLAAQGIVIRGSNNEQVVSIENIEVSGSNNANLCASGAIRVGGSNNAELYGPQSIVVGGSNNDCITSLQSIRVGGSNNARLKAPSITVGGSNNAQLEQKTPSVDSHHIDETLKMAMIQKLQKERYRNEISVYSCYNSRPQLSNIKKLIAATVLGTVLVWWQPKKK